MNETSTKKYAFVLGRERDLCFSELKAVLERFCFDFNDLIVTKNIAFFNSNVDEEIIASLMKVLGGTVKIYTIVGSYGSDLKNVIENYITEHPREGKLNFGLSAYTDKFRTRTINDLGLSIRKDLKKDISIRFIALREGIEVPTILSLKEKLALKGYEFAIFDDQVGVLIGTTNPEEWSERDYDKPRGDKRSGMLPPKLARIMVNLAIGEINKPKAESRKPKDLEIENWKLKINENILVLDPFCGSGNIALEALMLGCDVFASDISEKAVNDTKANVNWLRVKSEKLKVKSAVVQADATTDNFSDLLSTFDFRLSNYDDVVIVCEPYLGEPKKYLPSLHSTKGEYAKVQELYLGFLRNIKQLDCHSRPDRESSSKMDPRIKSEDDSHCGLVICLVFPLVETVEKRRYSLFAESVDEIEKIGYTLLTKPLLYGRDYQVVKREIVLLALNS